MLEKKEHLNLLIKLMNESEIKFINNKSNSRLGSDAKRTYVLNRFLNYYPEVYNNEILSTIDYLVRLTKLEIKLSVNTGIDKFFNEIEKKCCVL